MMSIDTLRQEISNFLGFTIPEDPVSFTTHAVWQEDGYRRIQVSYWGTEGDEIPAFLLLPDEVGEGTAVLIHHQHHGERHLGKSEVCGLVGDPLQAFGPALAQQGIIVLAPDSICFEDRRRNRSGTEPDEFDVAQHFNEMCYRLLQGDTLMRKILDDSARGISLLRAYPLVNPQHIGILGHSYGGSTTLFHAALDTRIQFACSSGAASSYTQKMANQTGIEMSLAIPSFATRFDVADLVKCVAPRRMLLVSATEDKFSQDADEIEKAAQTIFVEMGAADRLSHLRYAGGHPLTPERFGAIVHWFTA